MRCEDLFANCEQHYALCEHLYALLRRKCLHFRVLKTGMARAVSGPSMTAVRKAIHTCVWCKKPILVPVDVDQDGGPIVGVSNGFMHWPCRLLQHQAQERAELAHEQEVHAKRVDAGKRAAARLRTNAEDIFSIAERMGRKARGEEEE